MRPIGEQGACICSDAGARGWAVDEDAELQVFAAQKFR
jgi:hypothetical protein